MILEEVILLVTVVLLFVVVVIGTAVIFWTRKGQNYSMIEDMEKRVQNYLESSEYVSLDFSDYLEKKIREVEMAAHVKLNPRRIVIADIATELDCNEQADAGTQTELASTQSLPQIITVIPLTDAVIQME